MRTCLLAVLVAAGVSAMPGVSAQPMTWQAAYRDGENRFKAGDWQLVVDRMLMAIKLKVPVAGRRTATFSGTGQDPYVPHFFLAQAYQKLGRWQEALAAARDFQRLLSPRAGDAYFATIQSVINEADSNLAAKPGPSPSPTAGPPPPFDVAALRRQVQDLVSRGDYAVARREIDNATGLDATARPALVALITAAEAAERSVENAISRSDWATAQSALADLPAGNSRAAGFRGRIQQGLSASITQQAESGRYADARGLLSNSAAFLGTGPTRDLGDRINAIENAESRTEDAIGQRNWPTADGAWRVLPAAHPQRTPFADQIARGVIDRALAVGDYALARKELRSRQTALSASRATQLQTDIAAGDAAERQVAQAIGRRDWSAADTALGRLPVSHPKVAAFRKSILDGRATQGAAVLERDAIKAFYSGEYQRALDLLNLPALNASPSARAAFYRACSVVALDLLAGTTANAAQARTVFQGVAGSTDPRFAEDRRFVSRAILTVLRSQ